MAITAYSIDMMFGFIDSIVTHLDFTFWDSVKKTLAIGFIQDSAVQYYNYSRVGFGADEPSETLLELDNSRW